MGSSFEQKFGLSEAAAARMRRRRKLKDQVARAGISMGGISVIIAICLIFFYLLYEVMPLFMPADMEQRHTLEQAQWNTPIYSVIEEQGEIGLNVEQGKTYFYDVATGSELKAVALPVQNVTLFSKEAPVKRSFAVANASGDAIMLKQQYNHSFDENNKRTIDPTLEYPYGETPVQLLDEGQLANFAVRDNDEQVVYAMLTGDHKVSVKKFAKSSGMFDDSTTLEEQGSVAVPTTKKPNELLISLDQRWLYLIGDTWIETYNIAGDEPVLLSSLDVVDSGTTISEAVLLLGGSSLLVGDSKGNIHQWFLARDKEERLDLRKIRSFSLEGNPITVIETEHRRKGFIAADTQGNVGFFNTTAESNVLNRKLADTAISRLVVSPRGNVLVAQAGSQLPMVFDIDNEHPEVSFTSLWRKVWYEDYDESKFIWQSSSASNDFEPKFSLVPLTFGTLKAAFYAMLFAMPLAICGAIYTAYFMAPALRTKIKPTIELMEALPTVILGFLAGLWLAPLVELNLPGVFAVLFLTPILIILFAYGWSLLPRDIRTRVPDGWVPVLLIPIIIISVFISMGSSNFLEDSFFDGNMRHWLQNSVGLDFDQRNSLIVGIAMGFAVIPTIFSITEDAIFAVPKNLSFGSLALGASPWQTLVRVVMPTASPGIFSAVMIGFGRAVGETMIVLMATGNTPIMDINIFEGLRTLSANIAVEMPEAEVDSSHFRILFLSGLVLFVFTFVLNTTAETVRQRLRRKYGSL